MKKNVLPWLILLLIFCVAAVTAINQLKLTGDADGGGHNFNNLGGLQLGGQMAHTWNDAVGFGGGGGSLNPLALTNRDARSWTNVSLGVSEFSGDVDAPSFSGNGSLLTALNASQLASGTMDSARFPTIGTAGTYRSITFDAQGRETSGSNPTTFSGYAISDTWGNLGAVLSGTLPAGAFPILSGDVTTAGGSLATVLKNTGTAGTYRSVTFDAQGRETSGSNPTTVSGYALSDTWVNMAAALSGTVPSAALPHGSSSIFGAFKVDGTTVTETLGVLSAIGASSTVTNISGGVGTTNRQDGGTNIIEITSIVVTNAVYTNAGPNIVINNVLYLNTNSFGGLFGSYLSTINGNGTNLTIHQGFYESNSVNGNFTKITGSIFEITNMVTGGFMHLEPFYWYLTNSATHDGMTYSNGVLSMYGGRFEGSGAGLNNIPAAAITAGTLSATVLPAFTGDVTTSAGSSATTMKNTGTAGTYRSVTFDAQGRETAGSNPTTVSGYGLSDTWANLAAALTGFIPQASLASGSAGAGLKFLADDHTFKTVTALTNITGYSHGYFQIKTNFAGGSSPSTVLADMNGDGWLDAVVMYNGFCVVYTNSRAPNFSFVQACSVAVTSVAGSAITADVNSDGRMDVILSSRSGNYTAIYTNDGSGQIVQLGSNYSDGASGPNFVYLMTADFNGDTFPDYYFNASTVSGIMTNDGTGLFALSTNFPSVINPGGVNDVAEGDFNNDGRMDLALYASTKIYFLTNNGGGVFQYWVTNNIGGTATGGLVAGDFNNDGRMDYLYGGQTTPMFINVYTNNNNPATGFGLWSSNNVPFVNGTSYYLLGDFNGDGLLDYIQTQQGTPFTGVTYTNNGSQMVLQQTNLSAVAFGPLGGVGDINRDGWLDYVVANSASVAGGAGYLNTANFAGFMTGDGFHLTNANMVVAYASSAVTPANAWTPGTSDTIGLGTLSVNTTYLAWTAIKENFAQGTVMTANTTSTVTFNTTGKSEHVYNTSASTIASLTFNLSSSGVNAGMLNTYTTEGVVTAITVNNAAAEIGLANPTALTAHQTIIYRAIGNNSWIRIQ